MIAFDTEVSSNQPLVLLAAFVLGVLTVARVTRLLIDDDFPPIAWVRTRYIGAVPEKWGKLFECPWCMAPYVAMADILWAWGSGLHWSWWLGNVWAAASWLAAFLTVRDLPPDQR